LRFVEDVKVVGEAESAKEALWLAEELEPDLVILDLRLGDGSCGIETCREIKSLPEPPRVLVYTAYNALPDLAGATLAGADGYFHKGADHDVFVGAVRSAAAGETVWEAGVSPEETRAYVRYLAKLARLTRKEKQILDLVHKDRTNGQIARELFVNVQTVKNHVRNILRKFGVENRKDLNSFESFF
jgi:DNA-binding NarL/FixJ family response regulator